MKAYLIAPIAGGQPNFSGLPYKGFVLGAMSGIWGLYLIMGTSAQLASIAALLQTVGLCTIADLDKTVTGATKSEVDAWAQANFPSLPPVPPAWTNRQVIQALGEKVNEHFAIPGTDIQQGGLHPDASFRVLALAPQKASNFPIAVNGEAWKLINIGSDAAIWEVFSDELNLIQIHTVLYDTMLPVKTWGLLAVVQVYGTSFYPLAVLNTFDLPALELLARRDLIAGYLESKGYSNTATLRAATTEHAQIVGIVQALGYSEAQLWAAMHG